MKVISEYEKYDFSSWIEEKTNNIIHNCYQILETNPNEENKASIISALSNALSIIFVLNEKRDVCGDLLSYFAEKSYNEYQKWAVLIREPNRDRKYEFPSFGIVDDAVLSLITVDGTDRFRLPEMINHAKSNCGKNSEWLAMIENDYEKVVMGTMEWKTFYERHHDDYRKYVYSYSFNDFLCMIKGERNG